MRKILFIFYFLLLSFSVFSIDSSDPYYIELKNKVDSSGGNVQVILEIETQTPIEEIGENVKFNKGLIQVSNFKNDLESKQKRVENKLNKINKTKIKRGKVFPYIVLEVNSSNIDEILNLDNVKNVREDLLLDTALSFSLSQIGADIIHGQNFTGEGQTIAVLDTGFDIYHPMLSGQIIDEACYSLNLCPGGVPSLTGPGSSINCSGFGGCDHGTHVAGIIAGDNGAGLTGVAPDASLITINVFSDVGQPNVQAYTSDIISGLERVYNISGSYNISAVSMSLGGGSYTTNCDSYIPQMTTAINALKSVDIATIVASGNDGYSNSIAFPACISSAYSVGSVEDDSSVSAFSNSNNLIDFLAPGGSIYSAIPGGGYATLAGTSMATPHISGAWAVLKSIDPTLTSQEIYDALSSTSTYVTDGKNSVVKPLINLNLAADSTIIPNFTGGVSLINITMFEKINENVLYNPLKTGSGFFYDSNEIQSRYIGNGTIVFTNTHPNISVENIHVNFKNTNNIYNVSYLSGRQGFVDGISGNYLYLNIPDLGPGQTTIFRYDINSSSLTPPLNFTSSYSDSRVLAGSALTITDKVSNTLNNVSYLDDNCIYNISITQDALYVNNSGSLEHFIFDNSSIGGLDSLNVVSTNKTLTWNLNSNGCLYSGNSSDINYNLITPSQILNESNYKIINSSMSFNFNSTFSNLKLNKISSSIDLDLKFSKNLISVINSTDGTWQIQNLIQNPTNVGVNLKKVSLWVSVRDGAGGGFTNPSIIDNDSVSSSQLTKTYYPHSVLNYSINYTNIGDLWNFNYSHLQSPIVWMTLDHDVIDNDIQIQDFSLGIGESFNYVKELYITTGYYLKISKNVTRLSQNLFNVKIDLENIGPSQTPKDQVVVVYNFLSNSFNLNSSFVTSISPWYTTSSTNATLLDPIYNGTMYQFALLPQLSSNTSLDAFSGSRNINNSWSLEYNVSGNGEFSYDDLFLTGVDPLHAGNVGGTKAILVESKYSNSFNFNVILMFLSIIFTGIIFLS